MTDAEIKSLRQFAEQLLSQKCEMQFKQWQNKMINSLVGLDRPPPGLVERLRVFVEENRVSFYIGFKEALREQLRETIQSRPYSTTVEIRQVGKFGEQKDRLFLETFLLHKGNARRTSHALGIPKSTFHDWLKKNSELVRGELNKTRSAAP